MFVLLYAFSIHVRFPEITPITNFGNFPQLFLCTIPLHEMSSITIAILFFNKYIRITLISCICCSAVLRSPFSLLKPEGFIQFNSLKSIL